VADLQLTVGGHTISAGLLMARALAACTAKGPATSGGAELAGLVVNGQPISATGTPNQRVDLPAAGSYVVVNEHTSAGPGDLTVAAKLAGGNLQLQKPCQ
jgi:hypothetical protein